MTYKDVVVLSLQSFNHRDYERFGVEKLRAAGFRLVVIEVGNLYAPELSAHARPRPDYPHVHTVKRLAEVIDIIKGLDRPIITDLSSGSTSRALRAALAKTEAGYLSFLFSSLPEDHSLEKPPTLRERLWWLAKDPRRILNRLKGRRDNGPGRAPDLVVVAGGQAGKRLPPPGGYGKVVWAHALDYDVAQGVKDSPGLFEGREYGLFMDQFLPYHPDYALEGRQALFDGKEYYAAVNRFLGSLEQRFGIPMVVAAHPHGRYDEHPDLFPGRQLIHGQTALLARDAKFSVATHSISLGYPIMFNKPVLLITTDGVDRTRDIHFHVAFCKALGLPSLNIDHVAAEDDAVTLAFDDALYAKYVADYIKTPGSRDAPFWDIVAEALQSL